MKKPTFIAAAAVGYVLGTKAGRERYHQIVAGARRLGNRPAGAKVGPLTGQVVDPAAAKLDVTPPEAAVVAPVVDPPAKRTRPTPAKVTTGEAVLPDTARDA